MRIFLSSTAYDLHDIRDLAAQRIRSEGHEPVHHESPTFPVFLNQHSHDQCVLAVETCEILICIVDRRYGADYAGTLGTEFPDQTFKVKGRRSVTVPTNRLSVTWCELIRAHERGIPVMTFARQRTLDEKDTRRENQRLKSFKPAYAERTEVFDLLDWITKQETNNWIIPFATIIEFDEKLQRWLRALQAAVVPGKVEPERSDGHGTTVATTPTRAPSGETIGVLVEGPSDQAVVAAVVGSLDRSPRVFIQPTMSKAAFVGGFNDIVGQMLATFSRVVVVLDADTWSGDQINQELQQLHARRDAILELASRSRLEFVFAVPTIEAWVLGAIAPDTFTEVSGHASGRDLKVALEGIAPRWQRRLAELNPDFHRARGFVGGLDHFISLLLRD